jgi:hypothetical protein
MSTLSDQLSGGDRRSIGRSDQVVRQVLTAPGRLPELIAGLSSDDLVVRVRCADAVEKVSALHPDWLWPHKASLLELATRAAEPELRWHLAQMLPRLKLGPEEKHAVVATLFRYLEDKSRITATFALQALADLATQDPSLKRRLTPMIFDIARTGSPAMRARARKLAGRFQGETTSRR